MGSLEKRIKSLEGRVVGQPENPHASAARQRIIWALDWLARERRRQWVAFEDLVLETEVDREAWAGPHPSG
jgi:hypothetical protein